MKTLACILLISLCWASSISAQQTTTVFLVRHAEAVQSTDDRNPPLTDVGRARAQALVHVLGESGISAIYSTPFTRTRETARPLAELLDLEVIETPVGEDFIANLASTIRANHPGETVLIVGHSNTTPALINELGAGPLEQLGHDEHDDLFMVLLSGSTSTLLRVRFGKETP